MNLEIVLEQYPCIDIEELAFEVQNEKYYSNIVTCFLDAISQNLHYAKVIREQYLLEKFLQFENKYISYFNALFNEFELFKLSKNELSKVDNFKKLEPELRLAIREDSLYMNQIILIPSESLLILIGHDLKLIHLWNKTNSLNPTVLSFLSKNGIEY